MDLMNIASCVYDRFCPKKMHNLTILEMSHALCSLDFFGQGLELNNYLKVS